MVKSLGFVYAGIVGGLIGSFVTSMGIKLADAQTPAGPKQLGDVQVGNLTVTGKIALAGSMSTVAITSDFLRITKQFSGATWTGTFTGDALGLSWTDGTTGTMGTSIGPGKVDVSSGGGGAAMHTLINGEEVACTGPGRCNLSGWHLQSPSTSR